MGKSVTDVAIMLGALEGKQPDPNDPGGDTADNEQPGKPKPRVETAREFTMSDLPSQCAAVLSSR